MGQEKRKKIQRKNEAKTKPVPVVQITTKWILELFLLGFSMYPSEWRQERESYFASGVESRGGYTRFGRLLSESIADTRPTLVCTSNMTPNLPGHHPRIIWQDPDHLPTPVASSEAFTSSQIITVINIIIRNPESPSVIQYLKSSRRGSFHYSLGSNREPPKDPFCDDFSSAAVSHDTTPKTTHRLVPNETTA